MAPQTTNLNGISAPIGHIGYGLMGLTARATPPPQDQAFAAMTTALAQGSNFWNGGEFYGRPTRNSMHLLAEYFEKYPEAADKVVLSVKGGLVPGTFNPDGGEENVRRSVEECLRVLQAKGGKKGIDVFECARIDPKVEVEETMRVLGELVKEGKIGGVGLSEVKASTIERASKVVKIAGVEVELSLWATDILRNGVAEKCGGLGIPIIAYSPLSRGAMAGEVIKSNADIPEGDFRKHSPKFQDDVLAQNNKLTEEVEKLANKKGVTKAQIAIAWVRGLSGRTITTQDGKEVQLGMIIPIPGATTEARVLENTKQVELTDEEMKEIAGILKKYPVKGDRYPKEHMAHVEG